MKEKILKSTRIFFLILLVAGIFMGIFQVTSALDKTPFEESVLPTNPTVPVQNISQGVINSEERKIFYWIQVSDIHTQADDDHENNIALDRFCVEVNLTLKPAFVISTGDAVDGYGYVQNKEEYQRVNQTLAKYNFTSEFWFNLLGNHERYNTNLDTSLFTTYLQNETQYAVDINPGFGTYRFYMLDSTQKYALSNFMNLYGDMQTNELDNFEGLINANPDTKINQSVISLHHPTNEVFSEKSTNGNTFRTLIEKTNAQYVLNGHIHGTRLYVNRGNFNEIQVPCMKEKNYYRICAFDNDLMSFSDVVLNQYPQALITNPTDSGFYTSKMDLDRMRTEQEIRTLIFDNSSIISAYATIDGQVIGNLTAQGNNLWTVTYNPQDYATGTHHLEIYIKSANGEVVKEQEFQLSEFSATEIDTSMLNFYYKIPLDLVLLCVVFGLIGLGIFRLMYPHFINSQRLKQNQPVKYQPNEIPTKSMTMAILGLFTFVLTAPLIVGMLNNTTFGGIFFSRIIVKGGYILDIETYIIALIFVIFTWMNENLAFRLSSNRFSKIRLRFSLIFYYILLIGVTIFLISSLEVAVLLTPSIYVYLLTPLVLYAENKNRK